MTTWKWLKQIADQKVTTFQYVEDDNFYKIKLFDGQVFIDECAINKNLELSDKEDFETNYKSNSNQSISGRPNNTGTQGAITVGTQASQAKVGLLVLKDRKSVTALPIDGDIYWGYTALVDTSTGTPLYKGQFASWDLGPNVKIWLIADSDVEVRITEGA